MALEGLKKVAATKIGYGIKAKRIKAKVMLFVGIILLIAAIPAAIFSELIVGGVVLVIGLFLLIASWASKREANRLERSIGGSG
jgi:uncharacterized membrane protein